MTRVRHLRLLALAAVFSACDGQSPFEIAALPPAARIAVVAVPPGSEIPVSLISRSSKSWTYGRCNYLIDRLDDGTWEMVFDSRTQPCTLEAYSLRAGQTVTQYVPLPMEVGTYRLRFRFLHFPGDVADEVLVTSNTFAIGAVTLAK